MGPLYFDTKIQIVFQMPVTVIQKYGQWEVTMFMLEAQLRFLKRERQQ